jgi:outer membrane receptor protein involved in Fe transport
MEGNNIDTSHVWYPDWTQIKPNVSTGKPHGEIGDGPNNSSAKQKDLRAQLLLEYRINDKQLLTWNTNGRGAWFKNRDSLADAAAGRTVSGYPGKLYTAVSGLSLESELFDDRLVNLAGLKLYHYRYRVTESFQGLAASLVTNYDKKTSVGFSESFRLTIVKPLFFNAGYQHSLRIPDKDELFGDGAFITPNSKLKAESADNFHAGFLFDSWDFPFLTRAQLDVHGFCYFIKDMIRLKSNGMMSMAYYNVENVRILGTDAELKVDFTDWLYAWSNLTLQNPVCTKSSESSTLAGKQVPNIPTFFVNFGAELCKEGLFVHHGFGKLFWSGGYTEDFYFNWKTTSQSRSRMIPSSFTMDAGIEYSLFDTKLSFCAEVRNITGKETFDEYNTPLPGRSFALKVRGSFVK